ncbi:hypothetical protein RJ641_028523 [Dillenia turbinata]|uniref:Uncharacterized protein n=1 Tax=Dillenia turbinata TaxID=194707 RepID=A0AAN8W7A5_9MAGN
MIAKRLLHKGLHNLQQKVKHGDLSTADLDPRISIHHGIPSTGSLLPYNPILLLLAIGTLSSVHYSVARFVSAFILYYLNENLFILQFLKNWGRIVTIFIDNNIQVWNLESRCITCSIQWESNITAISVIHGSSYVYYPDVKHCSSFKLLGLCLLTANPLLECSLNLLLLGIGKTRLLDNILLDLVNFITLFPENLLSMKPDKTTNSIRVWLSFCVIIGLMELRLYCSVLIAYENELTMKDVVVDSATEVKDTPLDYLSEQHLEDKEITALCWASSSGSILSVGHMDSDILFWNMSTVSSSKGQQAGSSHDIVVKLQFSSAKRRLPVIVLHWLANGRSQVDGDGQRFIYGGDELGSEESRVLNLEWSSGMETLTSVCCLDLILNGSFADMILLHTGGISWRNQSSCLFVLTNPGQLHYYDENFLSASSFQQERKLLSIVETLPELSEVCIYNLSGDLDEASYHYVTEDNSTGDFSSYINYEFHPIPKSFFLVMGQDVVQGLPVVEHGLRVFVAVFDLSLLSGLYLTDCLSDGSNSASQASCGNQPEQSTSNPALKNEMMKDNTQDGIISQEELSSSELAPSKYGLLDSFVLLCCEDALRLYSSKFVIQRNLQLSLLLSLSVALGLVCNNKPVCKVKPFVPCCWSTTVKKGEICALALLYQNGVVEIRSLPDLELACRSSPMSILGWNFKAHMNKTMGSDDNGHIALVFFYLVARIPESFPEPHDKVLAAAAAAAAAGFSSYQKVKKDAFSASAQARNKLAECQHKLEEDRDGCPKIVNLGSAKTDISTKGKNMASRKDDNKKRGIHVRMPLFIRVL